MGKNSLRHSARVVVDFFFFSFSLFLSYTVEELCLIRFISALNILKKSLVNERMWNFLSRKT